MKIASAVFRQSAQGLDTCPPPRMPEFAFIGRSNVGKSSLINLLTGKKDLAKVSGTPGKTRLINFFEINGAWNLVDLPGYGYAKVARGDQLGFNRGAADYLMRRECIKQVFILVDARFETMPIDLEFIDWIRDRAAPFSVVFTKTDKVSKTQLDDNMRLFVENLEANALGAPKLFASSSKLRQGRGELLRCIESHLPKRKAGARKKKKATVSLAWMKKGR